VDGDRTAATRQRPIGWWLKEADAALDDAFDRAVGAVGGSRRGWQILTTLASGPATRAELAEELARFDTALVLTEVVDDLIIRGWVTETDPLTVTTEGRAVEAELAERVGEVRRRVAAALPDGDYDMLVQLLARLVAAVR
jgi:hypothetical protein